jgi:predicted ATPase
VHASVEVFDVLLTNLPAQMTSFVGRVRETEEVTRRVSSSRLVTLTGAGGCGKTRLALQAASGMGGTFAGGVWLVELASLCDPALTPVLVAQTLGVHPLPDQPLLDVLLNFVRPRRMLLILDNCEHLIAACAALAQTLLSAAPDLTILATSREPLALAGEMLYHVLPLSLPPALDPNHGTQTRSPALTPQAAGGYDAIRLFVERARAVLPDFALTPANTATVVSIERLFRAPHALANGAGRDNGRRTEGDLRLPAQPAAGGQSWKVNVRP